MQARIVSVADTFDAMTTDRPYQRAMKFEDALARIKSLVGTRYDERVVASLIAACESGQVRPGSVRLKRPPKERALIHPPAEQPSAPHASVPAA
jgi:HD-GYP domain-containing protein (c-di-GMP phosphodiesterase class II)